MVTATKYPISYIKVFHELFLVLYYPGCQLSSDQGYLYLLFCLLIWLLRQLTRSRVFATINCPVCVRNRPPSGNGTTEPVDVPTEQYLQAS